MIRRVVGRLKDIKHRVFPANANAFLRIHENLVWGTHRIGDEYYSIPPASYLFLDLESQIRSLDHHFNVRELTRWRVKDAQGMEHPSFLDMIYNKLWEFYNKDEEDRKNRKRELFHEKAKENTFEVVGELSDRPVNILIELQRGRVEEDGWGVRYKENAVYNATIHVQGKLFDHSKEYTYEILRKSQEGEDFYIRRVHRLIKVDNRRVRALEITDEKIKRLSIEKEIEEGLKDIYEIMKRLHGVKRIVLFDTKEWFFRKKDNVLTERYRGWGAHVERIARLDGELMELLRHLARAISENDREEAKSILFDIKNLLSGWRDRR